jgi:ABC-type polysaccharide/polyol phosphate export permease
LLLGYHWFLLWVFYLSSLYYFLSGQKFGSNSPSNFNT